MTEWHLDCRGRPLRVGGRTLIMGVINCTPDSFYSASRRRNVCEAVALGRSLVEEGADLLDVGGESTRPGAEPVSFEEELRRVLPVVKELADCTDVPISVDTYKVEVARRALEAGAHLVNDISGLTFDPSMANVVAQFDVPVVIMHIKGTPRDMQKNPFYDDVVAEISDFFRERMAYARSAGIPEENIILDPGIGFGKRLEDNYEILRRLSQFCEHRRPILVGPSRKSFIGRVLQLPAEECLEGTLAAGTAAVLAGAHILRVHDVQAMKRAAAVADRIKQRTGMPWMTN